MSKGRQSFPSERWWRLGALLSVLVTAALSSPHRPKEAASSPPTDAPLPYGEGEATASEHRGLKQGEAFLLGKRWRVHQVSAGLVSEQSLSPLRFEVQLLHQEVGLDGDLVTLHNQLAEQGRELLFATNGGMYHPDRMPVGLWIHGGETLSPLNVHSGEGNFFLRPNGVFALCSDRFVIQETHHFATELSRKSSPCHERRVREATQSGPLLLRNGQRHPKLKAQSQSRKRRNGVGIDAEGNALLVLSEDDVTLFELLRVFEELRCSDALYLDGVVSSLYEPGTQHLDRGRGLGPVIFVTTST